MNFLYRRRHILIVLRYFYIKNLVFNIKRGIGAQHVGNQQTSSQGNHTKPPKKNKNIPDFIPVFFIDDFFFSCDVCVSYFFSAKYRDTI